jgi:large subunit ribosomal protein L35
VKTFVLHPPHDTSEFSACEEGRVRRSFSPFSAMPKPIARSKTRKSVAKRFKMTARGKLVRAKGGRRHLLQSKSAKRKRKLAKSVVVHDSDTARLKACLPFG